ncbi:MAG: YfcC family protein, partial [Clostridiales bacterium]
MTKGISSEKKGFFSRFPDAAVIMIILILLAAALTYVIPAGEFDRVEDPATGMMVAVGDSFHKVEQNPVGFMDVFLAIPNGLASSAAVIFFVLMTGGSLGIVNSTGAINALIARSISKSNGGKNDKLIMVAIILLFGLLSATIGTFSEGLAFIPIIMVLMIALGYDALVATALVMASVCAGYGASTINPFNVGLAQGISGLDIGSGLWFRWIFWIVTMAVLIWYILRYAKKIKADPSKSLVKDVDY